jgi:hypothetical protein
MAFRNQIDTIIAGQWFIVFRFSCLISLICLNLKGYETQRHSDTGSQRNKLIL